jgi:hypothetical protein
MGVKVPKNKLKEYRTPLQARSALRDAFGVNNLAAVLDQFLGRINVAQALPGDIIELPAFADSEHGLGALSIYLGNNAVLMFEEEQSVLVSGRLTFDPDAPPLAAWRAIK